MFKRLLLCEIIAIIADESLQACDETLHDIGFCYLIAHSWLYNPWEKKHEPR